MNLFGKNEETQKDQKYSTKIKAPVYDPKNQQPHILKLCDDSKTNKLIQEIQSSSLLDDEKEFLIKAAHRHSVFYYNNIADYYAHATPEMQDLMEKSGLVIIDFKKAVKYGFVKLCKEIRKQYVEEYAK